ncbi:MAG TPA: TetR family transcriptional regulator [Polyangiaceae bacterium]|nr:TetR family transcriptional regulator [Polyangiaceae bacterium]
MTAATTDRRTSKRKKPPGLTRERIRSEALELIDAEGLEAFSTRKLGAALGCEAMAIYWYYPSKEALLDAVVDELMSRVGRVAAPEATDWVEALRGIARSYRGLAHEHPNAFPLIATRRFATEGTFAFLERLFELAQRQGIDDRTTARFFRAVSAYCSGIALNELASRREDEDLPVRGKFPRVTAVSKWLEPQYEGDLFEFGLGVLLDALARSVS